MKIQSLIKITSTIVITGALGLEFWNVYLHWHNTNLPASLNSFFWLGSAILVAHGIEALIAAVNAKARDHNPLSYGIYTFFVGYPGLQELFGN